MNRTELEARHYLPEDIIALNKPFKSFHSDASFSITVSLCKKMIAAFTTCGLFY